MVPDRCRSSLTDGMMLFWRKSHTETKEEDYADSSRKKRQKSVTSKVRPHQGASSSVVPTRQEPNELELGDMLGFNGCNELGSLNNYVQKNFYFRS